MLLPTLLTLGVLLLALSAAGCLLRQPSTSAVLANSLTSHAAVLAGLVLALGSAAVPAGRLLAAVCLLVLAQLTMAPGPSLLVSSQALVTSLLYAGFRTGRGRRLRASPGQWQGRSQVSGRGGVRSVAGGGVRVLAGMVSEC